MTRFLRHGNFIYNLDLVKVIIKRDDHVMLYYGQDEKFKIINNDEKINDQNFEEIAKGLK
jgi:hypothetical protein